MQLEKSGRPLPYSREQLYDLAADIEGYPQFLRGWRSAHILQRAGNTVRVAQTVGIGTLQLTFNTTAMLKRPDRIDVSSSDPMFAIFKLSFIISDAQDGLCRLSLSARMEMRSRLQQLIAGAALSTVVADTVAAFEARAHRLYSLR